MVGRVRTRTVKMASKLIIERFHAKLGLDFQTNKRICEEIAIIPSKKLRNRIAGFTTHLMKRIEKGSSIRGISIKLQEEERERRDNFQPEVSALDPSMLTIKICGDTKQMLQYLDLNIPNAVVIQDDATKPRKNVTA